MLDLQLTDNLEVASFKKRTGVPCGSTAKRTPKPKGQPSWVGVDKVPTEDNSIIVLETSAGYGFPLLVFSDWIGSDTTETAHLRGPIENLGLFEKANWALLQDLLKGSAILERRVEGRDEVGRWVVIQIQFLRELGNFRSRRRWWEAIFYLKRHMQIQFRNFLFCSFLFLVL